MKSRNVKEMNNFYFLSKKKDYFFIILLSIYKTNHERNLKQFFTYTYSIEIHPVPTSLSI